MDRYETQFALGDAVKRKSQRDTEAASPHKIKETGYEPVAASKRGIPKSVLIAGAVLILAGLLIGLFFLMREEEHVHTWSKATCTDPRTCKECGETQGSPAGHTWSAPDCDSPGICVICGQTSGAALGHQWRDATYESPKTCSVCGVKEGGPLIKTWIYLNELAYADHDGKVWTMSKETPSYYADSDITDRFAYEDEQTPGHVTGPVYDYLGNSYTYGLCVDGLLFKSFEVTYNLGGKYDTFSGYISMTPDVQWDKAADKGKYFEVYGDGELLYKSPTMTNSTPAIFFSVDISGVSRLTIVYPQSTGPSRMATIYDGKLSTE